MSHRAKTQLSCPIHGCKQARSQHVMCAPHWFKVSTQLREKIWALYRTARGSTAHVAAIAEAIRTVNETIRQIAETQAQHGAQPVA